MTANAYEIWDPQTQTWSQVTTQRVPALDETLRETHVKQVNGVKYVLMEDVRGCWFRKPLE